MSLEELAETLREKIAREIVDALNGETAIPDPAARADLCRRIGYRPAGFQLVSERRLREAARELFDAAIEARDLLVRRGRSEDRAAVARLERALQKALR